MKRKFFVAALSLLAITSIDTLRADAQSCPNVEAFGVRPSRPINNALRSQIEATYFTTDDPNVFISERAGISRSGSYTNLSANQFTAKIERLEREGVASVRKRQAATSFLGEMAELNLERDPVNASAGVINASLTTPNPNYVFGLNRETEISVYKGSPMDGDYYRVRLLSWFVNVTPNGARKTVDYDASILLKPGQTAVFKLMSNDEIGRSGSARSYMAVTLRSVDTVNLATLQRRPAAVASR